MNGSEETPEKRRLLRLTRISQKKEVLSTLIVVATKLRQLKADREFQAVCEEVIDLLRRELKEVEDELQRLLF